MKVIVKIDLIRFNKYAQEMYKAKGSNADASIHADS